MDNKGWCPSSPALPAAAAPQPASEAAFDVQSHLVQHFLPWLALDPQVFRQSHLEMQGTEPQNLLMQSTCSATELWPFPSVSGSIKPHILNHMGAAALLFSPAEMQYIGHLHIPALQGVGVDDPQSPCLLYSSMRYCSHMGRAKHPVPSHPVKGDSDMVYGTIPLGEWGQQEGLCYAALWITLAILLLQIKDGNRWVL